MSSPGQGSGAVVFPPGQYEALESAVMESARGRWFLSEYAKRNRAADTMMLLDALKKLENVASTNPIKPDRPLPDIGQLASTIKAARSEIASTHNDLLPDGGYLPADSALYDHITADAKSMGHEITKRSMSLRVIAGGLKAATADEEHVEAVEANARSLENLSWSQEVLSERIAKAMGLLSEIDNTLTGFSAEVEEAPLAGRQMPYFSRDEDLFTVPPEAPSEPPPLDLAAEMDKATQAAASAEKPRIVVIRRGKNEPLDIPLTG
ncbi:hypothetical protein [Taklimakanibacter albus]|uniref:Uncharacterized protein n=1 Tax=Taklimakanibacter albus TaxID=2800327 RepID=A0ACC5QY62_9HYPH|nr:hypothetical protein [Aestuariivirga sp. YIM B02566]MBK1865333.1 hypothetical protein [Aestuariivirga sp. YIM B02566]